MPQWAGRWLGGRFYVDTDGQKVFFIERRADGVQRSVRLRTHDEREAGAELALFMRDPGAYCAPKVPTHAGPLEPVLITTDRINLYLESIHGTVKDHREARFSYLLGWQLHDLDLRTVDRRALRAALTRFDGGHRGRVETINAFARFLVREGDLTAWNPLINTREADTTLRAPREAYSVKQLTDSYARLPAGSVRDLFIVRAMTGLHHTEIAQLVRCGETTEALPDGGAWVRRLDGRHEIKGVLQVMHKSRHRHRQSVDGQTLEAALRLRAHVPDRVTVWEALAPLVPSNLRHTFITLSGEVGKLVTYKAAGVDRARIAQTVGHRAGSTMTADRYDKLQVPAMIKLPIAWG